MSKFRPKTPKGRSAAEIRAEEEAKIKEENLTLQQQQEEARQNLRGRLANIPEDEEIARKRLLGQ